MLAQVRAQLADGGIPREDPDRRVRHGVVDELAGQARVHVDARGGEHPALSVGEAKNHVPDVPRERLTHCVENVEVNRVVHRLSAHQTDTLAGHYDTETRCVFVGLATRECRDSNALGARTCGRLSRLDPSSNLRDQGSLS